MANKKINELQTRTPSLSDLMLVGDPSSGYSYKCTVTSLATIIETDIADGYVTIGTTQTISGAKTFSNNLTLTSVSNAGVDTDKFLVLNGSNVVNFRTGSEVLSDIGAQGALSLTTTGSSGAATLVGNTLNIPNYTLSGLGGIGGSGTTNYVPKFTASTTLGNSLIYDNGTSVLINTTTPNALYKLFVDGNTYSNTYVAGTSFIILAGKNIILNNPTDNSYFQLYTDASNVLNFGFNGAYPKATLSLAGAATFLSSVTASSFVKTGGTSTQYLMADGSTSTLTNPVTGTGTTNYIPKFTSSSAIGNSIIQEVSGQIGIGAAPSAYSIGQALDINGGAGILGFNNQTYLTNNANYDGAWYYKATSAASMYFQENTGNHIWYSVASGTAGSSFTWSERMRLDASGNLGLGTSSPIEKFTSNGLIAVTGASATAYYVGNNNAAFLDYNSGDTRIGSQSSAGSSRITFYTTSSGYTGIAERMRLDASGNLGLGVTPSAWSLGKAYEINSVGNGLWSYSNDNIYLNQNAYFNSGWKYATSATAAQYIQFQGQHIWNTAASGTAGNAISFTQAMTLDASGRLGIGTTSPASYYATRLVTYANNEDGITIAGAGGIQYLMFADGTSGDDRYRGYIQYSHTSDFMAFASNAVERMRLTSTGNVGIGTTSPGSKLEINGDGNFKVASGNVGYSLTSNTTAYSFYLNSGDNSYRIYSSIGAIDRVVLTSGGNVGIGTTSPAVRLDVIEGGNPAAASAGTVARFVTAGGSGFDALIGIVGGTGGRSMIDLGDTGSSSIGRLGYDHTADFMFFQTNGSERMRLDASGNLGVGTSVNSGARINAFISEAGSAPNAILRLQNTGNSYLAKMIITDGTTNDGVIGYQGGSTSATQYLGFGIGVNPTQMILTAAGNVGIGTTSPTAKLHTYLADGANDNRLLIQQGSNGYAAAITLNGSNDAGSAYNYINSGTTGSTAMWQIGGGGVSNTMIMYTAGSERMRITSGGELLINTTTDVGDYKLQVNGNSYIGTATTSNVLNYFASGVAGVEINGGNGSATVGASAYLRIGDNSAGRYWIQQINNNNDLQLWYYNGTTWNTKQKFNNNGSIETTAPTGGTAKPFKIGAAATVTPTSPNRTIEIEIDGVTYYLTAKTTND